MPSIVIRPRDEDSAYEDERAREDWEAAERQMVTDRAYYGLCWPYACKSCGGWGVHSWIEKHDEGPGERMSEECPECLGGETNEVLAVCPRCAWVLYNHLKPALPCHACGWNYNEGVPSLG